MKLSEFEFISRVASLLSQQGVEVPIGDDAAVVRGEGELLILTTDALTQGSHYLKEWKGVVEELYYLLGKKLLNVCASDVAAMGGEPKFGLVTVSLTEESSDEDAVALFKGLGEEAERLGVKVIGGDTVKGECELFNMALIGRGEGYMVRSSARPGELVGVTGSFGDARGGLELLKEGKREPWSLVEKLLNPKARIEEGIGALRAGVECGTDVSDGLLFNLSTIAQASRVKIDVESSLIPISRELIETFGERKALEFALYGGEDYELIITFPKELKEKVEEIGFKVIGKVSEGEGVFLDGKRALIKGFEHFKEE